MARAHAIVGMTFAELADLLDVPIPRDSARAKGFGGTLVERALGGSAGNQPEPDFELLGVELKTIPLDREGLPIESTFVCSADVSRLITELFADSRVAHKTARVLFVPVEGDKTLIPAVRRVGQAALWIPDEMETSILEADYSLISKRIIAEGLEGVTGSLGRALHLRPKSTRKDANRAFYLRPSFTGPALHRAAGL